MAIDNAPLSERTFLRMIHAIWMGLIAGTATYVLISFAEYLAIEHRASRIEESTGCRVRVIPTDNRCIPFFIADGVPRWLCCQGDHK